METKTAQAAIVLRFMRRPTSRARSPWYHSRTMKTMTRTPKATSRPITVPEFQALVTPPYSMARMKHVSPPRTTATPGRSKV